MYNRYTRSRNGDSDLPAKSPSDALSRAKPYSDMDGVHLPGVDLSDRELCSISFVDAKLAYANFSNSDLAGANFERADLSGANFSGSNLKNANFSKAILRGADLNGAHLDNAVFDWADMQGVQALNTSAKNIYAEGIDPVGIVADVRFLALIKNSQSMSPISAPPVDPLGRKRNPGAWDGSPQHRIKSILIDDSVDFAREANPKGMYSRDGLPLVPTRITNPFGKTAKPPGKSENIKNIISSMVQASGMNIPDRDLDQLYMISVDSSGLPESKLAAIERYINNIDDELSMAKSRGLSYAEAARQALRQCLIILQSVAA